MPKHRALVTGAATRLGRTLALALADQGYDVAVHYHSSQKDAESVVNDIRAKGQKSAAIKADLLSEARTATLVAEAATALGGPLTCLVNNASIFEQDDLGSATRESWDRHIESNLRAPFVLTQSFALQAPEATLDENGEPIALGLVVNMIDQRVLKPTPEFMSYTIAKMGLWAFTKTAAQSLAPQIRVNGIGPGPTLKGAHQSETMFERQRSSTILERGASPNDIVGALLYLLNAPAVTGQMICVDGGQHLAWQTPDVDGFN